MPGGGTKKILQPSITSSAKKQALGLLFAVCSICVYVHLRVRDGKAIFRKPVADVAQARRRTALCTAGLARRPHR